MKPALRLTMAVISGLAGLYAILLVLQPAIVGSPQAWLLGSISLLIATNLVATVTDAVVQHQASLAGAGPPPATSADREVHGVALDREFAKFLKHSHAVFLSAG